MSLKCKPLLFMLLLNQDLVSTQAENAIHWLLDRLCFIVRVASGILILENVASMAYFATLLWKPLWKDTDRRPGQPLLLCAISANLHLRSPQRAAWTAAQAIAMSVSKYTILGERWKPSMNI